MEKDSTMRFYSFLCLLLCFCAGGSVRACSYAYQYGLYPLGASGGQIVVLEVEMERYVNHPDFNPAQHRVFSADIESRWKGSFRLCYWKEGGRLEYIQYIAKKIDISDSDYQAALLPYVQTAYEAAQALPFFEPARLADMGVCHYDIACPFFQKKVFAESGTADCYLESAFELRYPWQAPPGILRKFEDRTNDAFTKFDKLDTETRTNFYRIWKPYALRRYDIGGTTYLAFTLGWGEKLPVPIPTETEWRKQLPPVENFIEGQEILIHGYRFDFLVREKRP